MSIVMNKLQHKLFWGFFIPISIFMLAFEYFDFYDSAMVMYIWSAFFSFVILLCWTYWLIKSETRGVIFIVNGLLILSIFVEKFGNIIARSSFLNNSTNRYEEIIKTDWWAYRSFFETMILFWLATWIVSRIFFKPEAQRNIYQINGEKLPIFIVEDNESLIDLMEQSVKCLRYYCTQSCNSYKEAIKCFKPGTYVCALIDLNLGKGIEEGISLVKCLRELDPNIYIVVVSGYFDEIYDETLLLAADDFLLKPFDIQFFKLKIYLWTVKYQKRYERLGEQDFVISDSTVNIIIKKIIGEEKKEECNDGTFKELF